MTGMELRQAVEDLLAQIETTHVYGNKEPIPQWAAELKQVYDATAPDPAEMLNNTVATGAVAMLMQAGRTPALTSITVPNNGVPNQIEVTFAFMASPYRITIERVK